MHDRLSYRHRLTAVAYTHLATLRMAVNLGNDTDMMGSMAGAIVGALHPEALKQDDVRLVEQVNGYDFNTLAENIEKVISAR